MSDSERQYSKLLSACAIFLVCMYPTLAVGSACKTSLSEVIAGSDFSVGGVVEICRPEVERFLEENRGWLFSGVGVVLPTFFLGLFIGSHRRKREEQRHRELLAATSELRPKEPEPGKVPAGIKFGDQVILMPPLDTVFDRALWIHHCRTGSHPTMYAKYGHWINRGDPLYSFPIRTSFRKFERAEIRSPVSGLFLQNGDVFSDDHRFAGSILLPEDEPPPLDADYMFGQLCSMCFDYRHQIFQKPKELRGRRVFEDDNLRKIFEQQKSAIFKTELVWDWFEDHINEIKGRNPELRQLLPKKPS